MLNGLHKLISHGGKYFHKFKYIYDIGKGVFERGKEVYDAFKKRHELISHFRGHQAHNLLPHSKEHYDRLNKQGEDYARQRHQDEMERQQAEDIVSNIRHQVI